MQVMIIAVVVNCNIYKDGENCCRWFHGKISRKDTEKMLSFPGNCRGMFLVRESESVAGNQSIMPSTLEVILRLVLLLLL